MIPIVGKKYKLKKFETFDEKTLELLDDWNIPHDLDIWGKKCLCRESRFITDSEATGNYPETKMDPNGECVFTFDTSDGGSWDIPIFLLENSLKKSLDKILKA